jgi:hypothetical protein
MPATSPAQLFPYPITTDDPDVPDDMMKLAKAVEKRVMGVYTTEADRDTKTASAGVEEGMFAYTKNNDKIWYYDGAAWVQQTYPTITSGTTVPADSTGNNGDVFFKTA